PPRRTPPCPTRPSSDLPSLLVSLANHLHRMGADTITLLRRAQQQHPDDFYLNGILANRLSRQAEHLSGEEAEVMREEAIGFYRRDRKSTRLNSSHEWTS